MVQHALFARNKTQHSPVADEWARDHVKMKFATRKRRSLITMCRDFAACFNNEAVPPASVLQISMCRPRPVLVRRASAFLLPVPRRHELGAPRRTTLRLCSAACRPSCSSAVCSGAGLYPGGGGYGCVAEKSPTHATPVSRGTARGLNLTSGRSFSLARFNVFTHGTERAPLSSPTNERRGVLQGIATCHPLIWTSLAVPLAVHSQHCQCTANAQPFTASALPVHCQCTAIYCQYTASALPFTNDLLPVHCQCTGSEWLCTGSALPVHCQCTAIYCQCTAIYWEHELVGCCTREVVLTATKRYQMT
eukprot:gene23536-biopygen13374